METELVALARGGVEIVALLDSSGRCQLYEHLDALEHEHPKLWRTVAEFYSGYLPNIGLPPLVRAAGSRGKAVSPTRKVLRDGVEEFRLLSRRRLRDPLAYRGLYFKESARRLVVVSSHVKPLPSDAIDQAAEVRLRYLATRSHHTEGRVQ